MQTLSDLQNLLTIQKIIFGFDESNVESSVQSTIELFDYNFPYTSNLIISKLLYASFKSQCKKPEIICEYLKKLESKNDNSTNVPKITRIFRNYLAKVKKQEAYYILNKMILQGLIDTDFVQKIRTFYFQQYRPNQDLLFFPFYQEFRENYNKLSANDWKLQKELTNEGVNPSELVKVLREDDIQKLQEMSTQPNFDFNQCIEPSLYEKNSIINEANVTLIECCAFLGAIKCFKFLLMNGAKVENAGKYAVAGGNNEIIRLCEQNNSTFRGAFEKAIEYNRKEIFHYLFDSQIEDLNENKGIPQLDDNMQQIQNNLAKISSSLANALPGFDPTMFANLGNQQNLQQHPKVEEETNHESFFGKLFGSHKNELEPPQNEGEKDEAEYESFFNKLFGSNKNDTNEPEKEGDHETFFSKLFGSHQDDKDKPNEDEGDEGELNPGAFFGKLFGDIKSMFELLGDSENGENNNKENEKQNEDNKENVKEETQGENIENEKQNENDNKENVEKQNEKNEDNKENENNDEKDEKPNDNNKEDSLSPIKDNFTLDNMKKLLTLCIFYNNYELLSFLLTKGDFIDDKILNEVANCGDIFLFKCFSEKVPYSKKILTEVIFSGNPEFFSYIMKQDGFSIEKMYKDGLKPLTMSIGFNNMELIDYLLGIEGIDVNERNDLGEAFLISAARGGHIDIVKKLVQHKDIKLNVKDNMGSTALMVSLEFYHPEVALILLEQEGIDINIKNSLGVNALFYANNLGKDGQEVAEIIKKKRK